MRPQTRIAPTPSGYLHFGNVYAFLHTQKLAMQHGLDLRLRIDDLDRRRFRKAYLEDIFAVLKILGITWTFGPANAADFLQNHRQGLRTALYEQFLKELRASGLVYACSCSRAELAGLSQYPGYCRQKGLSLDDPAYAWRLRVTESATVGMLSFDDRAQQYRVQEYTGDFVVRRKAEAAHEPSLPAYQLACVANDDHDGTTHIVRGQDLFVSSLQQLYLANAIGAKQFSQIRFEHHPLILDEHGEKLSKSAGDHQGKSILHSYPDGDRLRKAVEAVKPLGMNH
jgi:glutamyl/glutaminyl-tRNA synthetase